MKSAIPALLVSVVFGLCAGPLRAENPTRFVELFTSQGCSSCPPADALLGEIAARPDVLAVSMHVDYWDHLGWRDPFGIPEAARRQREYAYRLGLRGLYTPQFVVQGVADVAGSDKQALVQAIDQATPATAAAALRYAAADRLSVEVDGPPPAGGADIWIIGFSPRVQTDVGRGENGGRVLVGFNVVRFLRKIGDWNVENEKILAQLSPDELRVPGRAVIVQARRGGRVLAIVPDG